MNPLADVLTRSATAAADRPAVNLGERVLTYAELDGASRNVAGFFAAKGVVAGDRVGIMLPNVPEFAAIYFGVLRAGATVVPLNPLLKTREVEYYLRDSGARAILAWGDITGEAVEGATRAGVELVEVDGAFLARLDSVAPTVPAAERADGDTAVILYTSGTTGTPKGAELSHGSLVKNLELVRRELLGLTPSDVVFGGLPLFHAFGQTVTLNATIAAGASLVLLQRFVPQHAATLIAERDVTIFAGVPTMYSALLALDAPPALHALRYSISGGAAMPVEVLHRFEQRFGCIVLEGYGLSETSPVASFNYADRRRPGSIGTPISGVEMRLVDSDGNEVAPGEAGEIAVRGHNVMKGYWHKPEATAEVLSPDGWFRTGDIGRQDDDGFFYVVDRKKDLIIRGGLNVYPREIEEVLYEHDAVIEAAVVGVPHAELGEEIAAVVALAPASNTTADELRDYVKGQVAAYKYPRIVWIVDALPKGATGKILKREIVIPASIADPSTPTASRS